MNKLRLIKKLILVAATSALLVNPAFAKELRVAVSMAAFDDNFLTLLRTAIQEVGKEKNIHLQIEDAKSDVGAQLNQIHNFIASGVDAIIVNPVDTDATVSISDDAAAAGIPLVYVNRQPINVDMLPDNQAFVASNEVDSGTMQTQEVCRLLEGKGDVLVIMGPLSNQAAIQRTKDIHDVIATPECSGMEVVAEQSTNWSRTEARDLMTNWLTTGIKFDAVITNCDCQALGAIQAMKAVGISMDSVVVAGIDADPDGLAAMDAGDLDVTVFQDAKAQGRGALDAAIRLAQGEDVPQKVWVPYELVTPANYKEYMKRH